MYEANDLDILIRSRIPVIVIETHEEPRVLELFRHLAIRQPNMLFKWTVTEGLQRIDIDMPPQRVIHKPVDVLKHVRMNTKAGIYLFLDFHPYLDEPHHIRLVKEIALRHEEVPNTLVFVSHAFAIPPEIEKHTARFEMSLPDASGLEHIVDTEVQAWERANPQQAVAVDRTAVAGMVRNLAGLTVQDARRLARRAIADDGALTHSDLPEVMAAKHRLLNRDGVLSFEYDTARFSEIGGMHRLKQWLEQRGAVFMAAAAPKGLDTPKGILLLGVQGCGKSLAAKAVAGVWGVPLLRLDFSALYNKFIGETERNLREALATAQVMAPCVLWIDEIEKGVAAGDSADGGTSKRLLGALLTWMAEREQAVFLAVTANNIEDLPPELIRKGRLDEIFFVDLPDAPTREAIFRIHLQKREVDTVGLSFERLVQLSEGFSGAEIEQVVVSALYSAHAQGEAVGQAGLAEALLRTRPLSVVMAEKIAYLRQWAAERTVPVNG